MYDGICIVEACGICIRKSANLRQDIGEGESGYGDALLLGGKAQTKGRIRGRGKLLMNKLFEHTQSHFNRTLTIWLNFHVRNSIALIIHVY